MQVVNIFAGPGAGKSTTSAYLFYLMKVNRYRVELVTEYAKELVYDGTLDNIGQCQILDEQNRRQYAYSNVDYVITDSPLLLQQAYTEVRDEQEVIRLAYESYNNLEFFLERSTDIRFEQFGRQQTHEESVELDRRIRELVPNVLTVRNPGRVAASEIFHMIEGNI